MTKILIPSLFLVAFAFTALAQVNLFKTENTTAYAKSWNANPIYGPFGTLCGAVEGTGSPTVEFTFPKGWYRITGGDYIKVDPSKIYRLRMELKSKDGNARKARIGFLCYDSNKNLIDVFDVTKNTQPIFILSTPLAKGDKKLTLSSPAEYRYHSAAVFDVKEDCSDLPNRTYAELKYSEKPVSSAELELAVPSAREFSAGTKVRLHPRWEVICRDVEVGNEWSPFAIRTTHENILRPGTRYVKPYIMMVSKTSAALLVRSVSVDEVSEK